MPLYRVYTLSKDERIQSAARIIDCPDDEAAIQKARQFLDGHSLEIWHEARKISRLDPDDKDGPP